MTAYKFNSCATKCWQNPAALNQHPLARVLFSVHLHLDLEAQLRRGAAELSHFQFPYGSAEVHHSFKSPWDLKTQQDSHPRGAVCITSPPLLARARFTTPLAVVLFSSFFFFFAFYVWFFSQRNTRDTWFINLLWDFINPKCLMINC